MQENKLKFYIKTYGCQMNFHDSALLEEGMLQKGFKKTSSGVDADIIILNTCSVREHADHKVLSDIGRIKTGEEKKDGKNGKKVILAGCYAKQKIMSATSGAINENIKNINEKPLPVNYLFGPEDILSIPDVLANGYTHSGKKIYCEAAPNNDLYYSKIKNLSNNKYKFKDAHPNSSEFIKITEGCNNYCSYCIVPYVRGTERSTPSDIILKTIKNYAEKGVGEIVLLGQNVNSYRSPDDNSHDFVFLLKKASEIEGIRKIKFLTSHPKDINDSVIELIAECDKISKELHLPFQSGSDRILNAMNREYSRARYLNIIKKLKSRCPAIVLSTDIIVGFPGETDEDFEMTLSLMKEVEFNFIFGFKYSPRPFTKAYGMEDNVALSIKKARLNRVFEVQKEISNSTPNRLK